MQENQTQNLRHHMPCGLGIILQRPFLSAEGSNQLNAVLKKKLKNLKKKLLKQE
jgi:hypothetical protein